MKTGVIVTILFGAVATLCFADPILVVVPNSHTKAGGIRSIEINGNAVKYSDAYDNLATLLRAAPAKQDTPIVVRIDENCSFVDWDSIRGLMDKIGFTQVRYFVFSKETNYMCEIKPSPAIPVSSNPPKQE